MALLLFSFINNWRVAIGSVWAITAPVADATMIAVSTAALVLCICFFVLSPGAAGLASTCNSTIIPCRPRGGGHDHGFVITVVPA
jgi:hypothetical protein